jgi:hypothetical protein
MQFASIHKNYWFHYLQYLISTNRRANQRVIPISSMAATAEPMEEEEVAAGGPILLGQLEAPAYVVTTLTRRDVVA